MTLAEKLFDSFKYKEKFTLLDAYNEVGEKPQETIRARIYDNIGIYFERIAKGIYKTIGSDKEACILIEGDGRDLSMLEDESIDCILTDHPWLDMKSNKGGTRAFAVYDCFKYSKEDFVEKARVLKEGCFLVEVLPAENENNYDYLYQIKQYASQIDNGGRNYDGRPFKTLEEMHEKILTRWNEKITNGDNVYILGDIAMRGKNEQLIALIAQLKGRKVLIQGNHDDLSDYRLKQVFAAVCDYKEISDSYGGKSYKLVLSHYPILMWNGQHKGSILLYGHTHVTREDDYFQECLQGMREEFFENREGTKQEVLAINVGCMMPYMDYEPRSLKELLDSRNQ